MPVIEFVYKCANKACGHVKQTACLEQSEMICPKCHSKMDLAGIENKSGIQGKQR